MLNISSNNTQLVKDSTQYSLPKAVFTNHNLSVINTDGNEYLKCNTLGCEFLISTKDAINYDKNITNIDRFITQIISKELVADLKQKIISDLEPKIKEKGLIQEQSSELLKEILDTTIDMRRGVDHFMVFDNDRLEGNINKFNQICPLMKNNFNDDYYAGKYTDTSKQIYDFPKESFESESPKNFLNNHYDVVKSLLTSISYKEILYLDNVNVILSEENLYLSLTINKPDTKLNNIKIITLECSKKSIETGKNGSDVLEKLKFLTILNLAMLKFKLLNDCAFDEDTSVYIKNWSVSKDHIKITSRTTQNIKLSDVVDIEQCEININKFKKTLAEKGIKYDDLICGSISSKKRKRSSKVVAD
jgi:hypothetical protein